MKILFITPEVSPFAKRGGLADVCASLPKALLKLGVQVDLIIPFYRCVKEQSVSFTKVAEDIPVTLGWRQLAADVYQTETKEGIRIFFIAREEFFDRPSIYGTNKGAYFDNAERYIFFNKAVLAFVEKIQEKWDIFHCHDWQAALLPVYLKTYYFGHPTFGLIKTVFTIHNLGYQGTFSAEVFPFTNLPPHLFSINGLEFWGQVNFLKGGIIFADALTTVSPTYAKEIQTAEYGFGLDGVLRVNVHKLKGILNGVDYSEWNPEIDPHIAANYSVSNLKGKDICKQDLIKTCGLPLDLEQKPLLGMVTRLVEQKGIDILLPVIERLIQKETSLVILGEGEKRLEEALKDIAARYPSQVCFNLGFDKTLAHKIIAGADMFLIPSKYEPCGLTQMYSLKYGTLPIVRNTGGLADTVTDADLDTGKGTGFKFDSYTPDALWDAIKRALLCYQEHKTVWHDLVQQAMTCDFSWERSAREYLALYKELTK
ncbi:MAG: glycogen synthase GlgA [Candidatus Desulfofervidaceae bacterium]|nr:glycogen synthase GlgA [Candidatus Desulfofervidaceae bacterium]